MTVFLFHRTRDRSWVPRSRALYIELGWGTKKEYSAARIARSIANCDIVVFARNSGGELVGISRVLSDFSTTTKILDMIIAPEYQRQGIGKRMMKKIESLVKGTDIYGETERKNFAFLEGRGVQKTERTYGVHKEDERINVVARVGIEPTTRRL